jgi:DNA-binding NtrC family response regulator
MAKNPPGGGKGGDSDRTEDAPDRTPRAAGPTSAHTLRLLFTGGQIVHRPPIRLAPGRAVVGRAPEHPIALPDEHRCSRAHASFELQAGVLRLRDEGSRNGSFVNGVRISEVEVQDGDLLRFGDALILVRAEGQAQGDGDVPEVLGDAPVVRTLRRDLTLLGPSAGNILLLGETGVGKEVAARAIHRLSGRVGPFVGVNASAIPESLAESQLFGHEAGAFTGAGARQLGLFRMAEGGTLFLDEIGELPLVLQPKLLRVLEERTVLPLGAAASVPVDVRIVAATNVDLRGALREVRFRADLYSRLSELSIELPPLRDRREDILLLFEHFLPAGGPALAVDLAEALLSYAWPFNVRELVTVAKELTLRGAGQDPLELALIAHRLTKAPPAPTAPPPTPEAKVNIPSREELMRALELYGGSIAEVAKSTGRSRTQVYRWLEHHRIDLGAYRR